MSLSEPKKSRLKANLVMEDKLVRGLKASRPIYHRLIIRSLLSLPYISFDPYRRTNK
jgi:hypothetical protein